MAAPANLTATTNRESEIVLSRDPSGDATISHFEHRARRRPEGGRDPDRTSPRSSRSTTTEGIWESTDNERNKGQM